MGLRKAHGSRADSLVRCETNPADELPLGAPAPMTVDAEEASRERGRFTPGNRRSVMGGKAKAGRARLATRLAMAKIPDDAAVAPYLRSATTFRRVQCASIASTFGGGVCGPGPSSIVASAATALAWSRHLSDRAAIENDPELAAKAVRLSDQARTMLLTASELAAREAMARRSSQAMTPEDWAQLVAASTKREGKP